jgi:hypothetical protein
VPLFTAKNRNDGSSLRACRSTDASLCCRGEAAELVVRHPSGPNPETG